MTKKEILDMTGLTEDEFYAQYPTEESFQKAMGGMVDGYKSGGWIKKAAASIKRRGTEGKCTPMTKPGCTGRALALAKTFHKIAARRKKHEDGGMVDMYAEGGQLPQDLLEARMRASGASQDEIDSYVADNYAQGGEVDMYGRGGYTVKRSSARKGKTHVVIGPDGTKKYFGDSKLGQHPDNPARKKAFYARHAKNLKNNPYFRAFARATWADGGMVDTYADGGELTYVAGTNKIPNKGRRHAHSSMGRFKRTPLPYMDEMPMLGFSNMQGYSNPTPTGVNVPQHDFATSNSPYMMDMRGTLSETPPTAYPYTREQLLKMGYHKEGGVVDVYQLMGMPTPRMYGMGSDVTIGTYSHVFSPKNHPNMGMAMGGGINGPNLLQVDTGNMPKFAMGGMTGQPTEINVEKGELLIDPKTNKILTKYLGGGMVPHPKKGIDKRGTVIAKEGDFVIPKKYAPEFVAAKENNNILVLERIKNNTVIEKAQKEAKDAQIAAVEEQKANKAMNRIVAKYGGAIQRMYAKGGTIPMYQGGARVNPFLQNVTRNLQPNPFLEGLMQNANASSTLAPADRPYNSNVGMGAGLNTAVANYMGNNQFYQTGPNYTPNPGTTGSRSVRDMMSGLQPSPFLQRITEGVQPSPFLQRSFGRPAAQPSSTATSAGIYTAPRPAYTTPTNTATTRPIGTRPATSARPVRPTFEVMTPMAMRGIDLNQLNPASPSSAYADNFDMGNIGENERMYEPYGSSMELTPDELWGSPGSTTIPGTGSTLTGQDLWSTRNVSQSPSWFNRAMGAGQGAGASQGLGTMGGISKAESLARLVPVGWNLIQAMRKPTQVPKDLGMVEGSIKAPKLSADAAMREIERQAALGKYNARQIGGSNMMAGLTNLAANRMAAVAGTQENLRNAQGQLDFQAAMQDMARKEFNAQQAMKRYELQAQADDIPGEYASAAMTGIGKYGDVLAQDRRTREFLNRAYPQRSNVTIPGLSDMNVSGYTSGGQRVAAPSTGSTMQDFYNTKRDFDRYKRQRGYSFNPYMPQ